MPNPLQLQRVIYPAGALGGFAGALDAYANNLVVVAGSRRWLGSYTGPCLRARKAVSGNPEMDFNFTSTGDLDLTDLAAWAGSDSVFLKGFYDQKSGSLVAQTTTSAQLRLVNAGTMHTTAGGKIKPTATGANMGGYSLNFGSYSGSTATVCASHCIASTSGISYARVASLTSGAGDDFASATSIALILRHLLNNTVVGYRNGAALGAGDAITTDAIFAASARLTGSNHVITTDGTTVSAASSGALSVNTLVWGGSASGSPYMHTGDSLYSIVLATSDLGSSTTEAIRQLLAAYHT